MGQSRTVSGAAIVLALTLLGMLAACSAPTMDQAASPVVSTSPSSSPTPKPTRTPPPDSDGDGVPDASDAFPNEATKSKQLRYPSGDPVIEGYPVVVDTAQIDYRVANWIKTPQVVAVAPGVYVGYNSAVPDLSKYLDAPADGDCVVQDAYGFTGTCWNGVPPSPAEPAQ